MYTNPFDTRQPLAKPAPNPIKIPPINALNKVFPSLPCNLNSPFPNEQQARYYTIIEDLEARIKAADTSEKIKLKNQLKVIKNQDEEIKTYEEKIHHLADQMISIDLDDGVKNNYELFKDVLAKIR